VGCWDPPLEVSCRSLTITGRSQSRGVFNYRPPSDPPRQTRHPLACWGPKTRTWLLSCDLERAESVWPPSSPEVMQQYPLCRLVDTPLLGWNFMQNAVLWDVTLCGPCKNRRFGGTHRIRHQGELLLSANVVPCSHIFSNVMMKAISSSLIFGSYKSHTATFSTRRPSS
jgi:hypothetical protein